MAKRGRPTKYKPEYCEKIIEHYTVDLAKTHLKTITTKNGTVIKEKVPDIPFFPTMAGFAGKIGVSEEILYDWQKAFPDFQQSCRRAMALGKEILLAFGLRGDYESNIVKFVAINCHGMIDKSRQEQTGADGGPVVTTFRVIYDDKPVDSGKE